jgi:hypothetical protein
MADFSAVARTSDPRQRLTENHLAANLRGAAACWLQLVRKDRVLLRLVDRRRNDAEILPEHPAEMR